MMSQSGHKKCAECDQRVDLDYGDGRLCFDCAAEARRASRTAFAGYVEVACVLLVIAALISVGWAWWAERW